LVVLVNIESEGPYAPERLLLEAIKIAREKIANIRRGVEMLLDEGGAAESEDVEMV
jgi:DNA-directed RNA polymerase I and III subunit RPAC1